MPSEVTQLLQQWGRGSQAAFDALTPLVYDELHERARNYLRQERPDHTLQPTALIHEVYMRMVGEEQPHFQNRSHFFAIAARAMRRVLVDHARRRGARKRGSGADNLSLDEALIPSESDNTDILALDEALGKLAVYDERKCRIVEMRYFGGCTVEEVAEALNVAVITVVRDTRMAEAWLRRALRGEDPAAS